MKRIALLVLAVMLVACVTVYATVAFFTDSEEVTNTFTVGKVSIRLDEEKVDSYGITTDTGRTETGNHYNLVPGRTYMKDPRITVFEESEPCYVRIIVTINNYADLKNMMGGAFWPHEHVAGWDPEIWPCVSFTVNADDTVTCEFRYPGIVDAKDAVQVLKPLFTSITVPGELTKEDLDKLMDDPATPDVVEPEFKIHIVGHAIQAHGFENADLAWDAFDQQNSR